MKNKNPELENSSLSSFQARIPKLRLLKKFYDLNDTKVEGLPIPSENNFFHPRRLFSDYKSAKSTDNLKLVRFSKVKQGDESPLGFIWKKDRDFVQTFTEEILQLYRLIYYNEEINNLKKVFLLKMIFLLITTIIFLILAVLEYTGKVLSFSHLISRIYVVGVYLLLAAISAFFYFSNFYKYSRQSALLRFKIVKRFNMEVMFSLGARVIVSKYYTEPWIAIYFVKTIDRYSYFDKKYDRNNKQQSTAKDLQKPLINISN